MNNSQLIYVYDPMCSWCWGFQKCWQKIQDALANEVDIIYKVGGLAADSDQPMTVSMQQFLQQTWQRIGQQTGAKFNFDFWQNCQPRRSTYPACRAVIAARYFNKERVMLGAIQQGYYLSAQNPSDLNTLVSCAQQIGIAADEFLAILQSEQLEQAFQQELAYVQQLPVQGFPSLVLCHKQQYFAIAINYTNANAMISTIHCILAD
ncbi:DsbA family protein [Pseudoalteromonas sp. SG41-1]|uniref:DsbA family protein n=1 Tax=Pseudoalteromonas sp. SG41-1 TaxID=2760979 RepID=UPI0015FF7081|nr:DsbA family protein [Pseudoalteromonas sp. SG41-1]MBB1505819.1 DsbA family protein [Pseudoalteromonas sp. SG41-1]|tara:strand:+ start:531 stop:1148 length:618 start_codon:yes stop_codon:yes gene_type:complete